MFERSRGIIAEAMREYALPSVAVAVARDGRVLWEEAWGWADRERRVPATPDTLYSLASISKPITATGLMVLVERGLVTLDHPANDYLGEAKLIGYAGDAREATVRRVANHTSGLPLHYHFFYADEERRRPLMDETIRRYGNLTAAPGERYQYSNLGYGVLDYIVERVSGRSFAEFMRSEVFLPLGMTHSSVDIPSGLEPYAAARYAADALPYPFYTFDHPGASAVYASAHDLLRFGMFHSGQRLGDQKSILSDASIAEMPRATSTPGDGRGYGVGWRSILDDHGVVSVGHDGGMGGVRTVLRLIPSERIAVVVLCNASGQSGVVPYGMAEEIIAELLPEYGERLAARKADGYVPGRPDEPKSPPLGREPALLGEWRGTVRTMSGERPFSLSFRDDGDVVAQYAGQLKTLVNDPGYERGHLTGAILGDIDTPDASYRPHHLQLDLRLRSGDVLEGALLAVSLPADSGAAGRRMGNALNHWTRLERVRA